MVSSTERHHVIIYAIGIVPCSLTDKRSQSHINAVLHMKHDYSVTLHLILSIGILRLLHALPVLQYVPIQHYLQ